MLVRLLLAVLMVTGPAPVRVCTCAAAGPTRTTAEASAPPAAPESGCACRHNAASHSVAAADEDHPDHDCAEGAPDRHAPGCPAVNPRPVLSAAVPTPAVDGPPDAGCLVCAWGLPSPPAYRPPGPPRPPSPADPTAVPLYISLLSIRI